MLKQVLVTLLVVFSAASSADAKAETDTPQKAPPQKIETAIFAGGCFWCMESPFDKLDGVISTVSGYTGGKAKNPSYKQVVTGGTGHMEAVKISYDPAKISYRQLLKTFWVNIDPTNDKGQFCDRGSQYLSAIFYSSQQQHSAAEQSLVAIEKAKLLHKPIVTSILPAQQFYPAEEYHQDYYLKNPVRYRFYRAGCKRDRRLRMLWNGKTLPF